MPRSPAHILEDVPAALQHGLGHFARPSGSAGRPLDVHAELDLADASSRRSGGGSPRTTFVVRWLGRVVLFAATVVFTLIGLRNLIDPVGAARAFGTSFGSAAGVTSMRVGFGAFPLAFAAVLAVCLISQRRRLFGLGMVATIMGLATAARLLGIAVDGPAAESSRLLAPEIAFTALSLLCIAFEWSARRGVMPSAADEAGRLATAGRPGTGRLRRGVGSTLLALVWLTLVGSAIAKLAGVPPVVAELGRLGFTRLLPLVGVLELASAVLVALPLTRPVGLLMASAFLGGAIATHLQHGLSPVQPAVPLALLWVGAWLRHPELAAVARRSDHRDRQHPIGAAASDRRGEPVHVRLEAR